MFKTVTRVMLILVSVCIVASLFVVVPVQAGSTSLENRSNFSVQTSSFDQSLLTGSLTGYALTAGDLLRVSWKGQYAFSLLPPRVYLLNDYQFHGWDYYRKWIFQSPASRGYIGVYDSWEMTVNYTVAVSGTYYVIIDNPNWTPDILPPSVGIISYEAIQNYPDSYYLSVKTDPPAITTVPGEGWYLRGHNTTLAAPATVTITSTLQYRFDYWDVDGASCSKGVNPIIVCVYPNRTATAHYVLYSLLEHKNPFLVQTSTHEESLLVGSISGYSMTTGETLFVSWQGNTVLMGGTLRLYLFNNYQFHGWIWNILSGGNPTRGYLIQSDSWADTINYQVTSSDTYYVIIECRGIHTEWIPATINVTAYDAYKIMPIMYYLSVKTDPVGIVSIGGEGWYIQGSNPVLTAPSTVVVGSTTRYVFDYWDVDGTAYNAGLNPIAVGMNSNHTAIAHYILQYQISFMQSGLDSSATGTIALVNNIQKTFSNLPYTFWKNNGSVIVYAYNVTVPSSTTTKQFILKNVVGPTSPITIAGPITITGNYGAQYQIAFNQIGIGTDFSGVIVTIDTTEYSLTTLPASFWWDSGSSHSFSFASPLVVGASSKQCVWTSTTGLSTVQSGSLTVMAYGSIIGNYKTQYYLTVTSPYDSPTPASGWFDSGTGVTASVNSPAAGASGTRYVCTGWTGTGSVPSSGSGSTITFTIAQSSSIVWNWKTQYQVTFSQTGVGSDFTGTAFVVDGVNYTSSSSPTFWWDSGSTHTFSFISPLVVDPSVQYYWVSTSGLTPLQSGTLTVTDSGSVVGSYATQNKHQVTFGQTWVSTEFNGIVVIIEGVNYNVTQLPVSFWWDPSSAHTFAYQSPLVVTPNAEQYIWASTSGLSALQNGSVTVTTSGNIIGNYMIQYYLSVTSPYDSPSPTSGWFNSGTGIMASVNSPVAGSSGVQYMCIGWSGTGSVTSSGSGSSTTFTISQPSSIMWNWKTQYYLTVKTDPVGIAAIPGEGWYYQTSSVTLTAPAAQNYAFVYWDLDGASQGNGTNPITTTMNARHVATAHYAYSNPLTVHIQPTSANINLGQSVAFTSTVQGGTPPHTYQWYLNANPISGATSNGRMLIPSTTGIYYVHLQAKDFNNITAQSETARIVVSASAVGGYSVSFDKHTMVKPLAFNFALVMGLALFLVALKRKAVRRRD